MQNYTLLKFQLLYIIYIIINDFVDIILTFFLNIFINF